jgi:hypothetical protein
MSNTIYFADALPGTGKTEALIQSLANRDCPQTVIAVPTLRLAESIERRIITAIPGFTEVRRIDSKRHRRGLGNVVQNVAKHLKAKDEKVLIIQQNTLKNLAEEPEILNGWRLVIDEVPSVLDHSRFPKGFREFAMLFDSILEGHPFDRENAPSKDYEVTVRDDSWWEAKELMAGWKRNPQGNMNNHALLSAAMDEKSALFIKKGSAASDMSGSLDVRVAKYTYWASLFSEADEVHILGHASKKSLMALYLSSNGFIIKNSLLCPPSGLRGESYTGDCTIYVLTALERSSRTRLLVDMDGNPMREAVEGSFAFGVAKAASDHIRELNLKERAILQAFRGNGWFSDENVEALENLNLIGYAVEGLNCYRDVTASVSLIHGNCSPEDRWIVERVLALMNVDVDTGLERLRHEMQFEAQFQNATRTAIREFDPSIQTHHYVITMEEAESLKEKFNMGERCRIDTSLMMEAPVMKPQGQGPKRTAVRQAKKKAKEATMLKSMEMLAFGWTQNEVAGAMSVSRATLNRWKQAAALCSGISSGAC